MNIGAHIRMDPAMQTMITLMALLCTRHGFYADEEIADFFQPLVGKMVIEDEAVVTVRLQYPYGNEFRAGVAFLKQHELSIYRPSMRAYWQDGYAVSEGNGEAVELED